MSHNRNPMGNNQYARVPSAEDPELVAALTKYHREGKTSNKLISELLMVEYNIKASDSSVKRRRAELGLKGSGATTREMPYQQKLQLVLDELDSDPSRGRGLDNIRYRIAFNHGIHLTRDFISDVMHIQDEDGKNPVGIHERWSGDGHDKLNSIGFPIWAVVDDATSKWLGGWVVPSNRLGTIIGYLYLCLVEKFGGVPLQFTTDCGSETTQMYGYQNALRAAFYPTIDPQELPAHVYVRSVHNISIERSWLRLRLEWGNNAVQIFNDGVQSGLYNPHDRNQFELCQWLWPKLLQHELDQFMEFRNGVRMRKDKNKAGPSGCSRNDAFSLYEKWGGQNCLLPVDVDVIRKMKEFMGGDELLSFVPLAFAERAELTYIALNIDVTMSNVWLVFNQMLPILFP
ncbi:hypothetical protein BYT27DRAFT_7221251 [Phlegmacium glaucopus]|nr:hypothetical protein BYT27DRAFT_7221251 [Phlegmacium glaucopus]